MLQASRRLLQGTPRAGTFSRQLYRHQSYPLAVAPNYYSDHDRTIRFGSSSGISLGPAAGDGLLVVSILGPPNAGKSTLFNRFMCKELNKSYRLTSDKKRRRKQNSKGRIGSMADSKRRNLNRGGAIVTNVPGTTRDRREFYGRIGGTVFRLVDTGGVDAVRIGHLFKNPKGEKSIDHLMIEQTLEAAKASDLVLLMFDARIGVTSDLSETARWLRKVRKDTQVRRVWTKENQHVVLLANKLEGDRWQYDDNSPVLDYLSEATRVGFGEAVPISAEHGEGMADIATLIEELSERKRQALGYGRENVYTFAVEEKAKAKARAKEQAKAEAKAKANGQPTTEAKQTDTKEKEEEKEEKPLQLAILGRPNVGKSTLVNALLGENRVIAGSTPGLTRDAITVEWSWNGRPVQLVDTAGIRKITHRSTEIEDRSVQDANRAMKIADVAVLVLDAQAGNLRIQEMAIADAVVKEGRALVVAANKMDLIVDAGEEDGVPYTPQQFGQQVAEEIEGRLPPLRKTPVVPMSSLTGENVDKLMPVVFDARDRWERTVSTGLLNRWLSDVIDAHPPPRVEGQRVTKIKYIIQTKGRPPTFLLFANVSSLPPNYMRHLRRNFQDTFEMFGMEVRFSVKKSSSTNPYDLGNKSKRVGSGLGGREARKKRMIHALKTTGAPPSKRRGRR